MYTNIKMILRKQSIHSGKLKKGLLRYTFIVKTSLINKLKKRALDSNLSIKKLLEVILVGYFKETSISETKNQSALIDYLEKKEL